MGYLMVFNVDGGCRQNGQDDAIGAAACCLRYRGTNRYRHTAQHLPRFPPPTNQRAEITAIIIALEWALKRYAVLQKRPRLVVTILTDSKYAIGCMTSWANHWRSNGWLNAKGSNVKNRDLIEYALELDGRIKELGRVKYVWVSRKKNSNADKHCNEALDEQSFFRRNYGLLTS